MSSAPSIASLVNWDYERITTYYTLSGSNWVFYEKDELEGHYEYPMGIDLPQSGTFEQINEVATHISGPLDNLQRTKQTTIITWNKVATGSVVYTGQVFNEYSERPDSNWVVMWENTQSLSHSQSIQIVNERNANNTRQHESSRMCRYAYYEEINNGGEYKKTERVNSVKNFKIVNNDTRSLEVSFLGDSYKLSDGSHIDSYHSSNDYLSKWYVSAGTSQTGLFPLATHPILQDKYYTAGFSTFLGGWKMWEMVESN